MDRNSASKPPSPPCQVAGALLANRQGSVWVQSTNRARRFTITTRRRWGHEHGLEVKPPRFISATSRPDPSPGQELHIESPVFAGPAPSLSRLCRVTGKLPPASVGICGRPVIPARFSCRPAGLPLPDIDLLFCSASTAAPSGHICLWLAPVLP